jgi:hypothetical protein
MNSGQPVGTVDLAPLIASLPFKRISEEEAIRCLEMVGWRAPAATRNESARALFFSMVWYNEVVLYPPTPGQLGPDGNAKDVERVRIERAPADTATAPRFVPFIADNPGFPPFVRDVQDAIAEDLATGDSRFVEAVRQALEQINNEKQHESEATSNE